jgi:hypothetical protein
MKQKVVFLFLVATYALRAQAVPPGDLYCFEIPPMQPMVFEGAALTCEKGKAPTEKANICVENVGCGYVSGETKKAAKDSDGNKAIFEKLTAAERTNYLKSTNFESFPSILTCPMVPGATTCPDPNDCNGDKYYKGRLTNFRDAKVLELLKHQQQGINNLYPAGNGPATKTGQ